MASCEREGTCLSHYRGKAIRQSRVALAWPTPLARSQRQPLLAITREGLWLEAACYQLLPWPHRLDLSISQCLLFCNSKKKGSSWLILGSFSCVVSLLGVINNSIKISQHTGRQHRTGAGRGPGKEISEGPAMGPRPIKRIQSWNFFDFTSQACMCLPSDAMLAVILARWHVWCSHPAGGVVMERNFRLARNKVSHIISLKVLAP